MDQSLPFTDMLDLARVARLVRPFETLEPRAVRRPGGGWSIGYGHVRSAREGAEVTRDEAEALLLYDLHNVASVVRAAVFAPIHRNQLEALVAFAFHIGIDNFLHSTTLHRFNAGDSLGAAQEIERWRCADLDGEAQVVDAMVRRRAAEKAHFLTPPGGFPKASRTRVRPQFEASTAAPVVEPADAAPSAALAAAHNVSARLRALVPDVADQAEFRPSSFESQSEPQLEPEPAAVRSLAETVAEPQETAAEPVQAPVAAAAAAAAAPLMLDALATSEVEIPPPPMPVQATARHETPKPAPMSPTLYDVWPSLAPTELPADDPFSQRPLDQSPMDTASIEAPPFDRSAPISSLFRARPEPRVQIPPRSDPNRATPSRHMPWAGLPKSWLWAGIALGLLIFIWAIWSIFTTNPSLINFMAGLVGIAVMAGPAYLLLGAKPK
jgi:lysozyme